MHPLLLLLFLSLVSCTISLLKPIYFSLTSLGYWNSSSFSVSFLLPSAHLPTNAVSQSLVVNMSSVWSVSMFSSLSTKVFTRNGTKSVSIRILIMFSLHFLCFIFWGRLPLNELSELFYVMWCFFNVNFKKQNSTFLHYTFLFSFVR